ncbi:MAG: thiamine pyrophosphate-dependent enzyme [Rhodospirillaceae bacterium]
MVMKRDAMLRCLANHVDDEQIVVAAYSSAFDWIALRPSPFNYISSGAMGMTSSHALGFAIGWPNRKILCLDGDGSLLMNLGSLVTIAEAAPKNLIHCVADNGLYEANGPHPTPGSGKTDYAAMAQGAGYKAVFEFDDLANFEQQIGDVLSNSGPVFVWLKIEKGEDFPKDYKLMHGREIRQKFSEAVKKF